MRAGILRMQFSNLSGLQRRSWSTTSFASRLTIVLPGITFGARPLFVLHCQTRETAGRSVCNTREIEMIHVLHPLSELDTVSIA